MSGATEGGSACLIQERNLPPMKRFAREAPRTWRSLFAVAALATMLPMQALAADTAEPVEPKPSLPAGTSVVVFSTDEAQWAVTRDTAEAARKAGRDVADPAVRLDLVARAVVEGPTPQEASVGMRSILPEGTEVRHVILKDGGQEVESAAVTLVLQFPAGFLTGPEFTESIVENTARQFHGSLEAAARVSSLDILAQDGPDGETRPIRGWLPPPPKFEREPDLAGLDGTPVLPAEAADKARNVPYNPGPVTGALTGKTVVFNQAHGWYWTGSTWALQRTLLWESQEDFAPAEFINHFVIPMIQNAGGLVQAVREPDSQTRMVIVDNAEGSPAYTETGTWSNSTANGFVNKAGASWDGTSANPFGTASATRFANLTPGAPTATATYSPNIPADGFYNVYISYSSSSNRTTQARWQVHHSGGVTEFRVNQQRNGATWLLLGNFHFLAGRNANGKVVVLNDAANGSVVSCDAVRFGGGMGDVNRRGGGISNKERWTEEATNHITYLGGNAPGGPLVGDNLANNDMQLGWSNRPQYASWEQSRDGEGADTVYIGVHTNAFTGTCSGGVEVPAAARGMGSYRDTNANATPATVALTSAVHNASVDNIKKFYDSTWSDRGITASSSYGECSQANLGTVAGFFFEALFGDNTADLYPWRDPKFRYIFARAIQQGVITYYNGVASVYPPEPPVNLRVRNIGGGQVRLDWTAGPVRTSTLPYGSAATGYRVFTSTNGFGFDNGTNVATNNTTLALAPGQVRFFRVVAVNSAGISIPTETLGAGVTSSAQAPALVVNGTYRYDMYMPRLVNGSGACSGGKVRKIDPRTFQSFNYAVQHGLALGAAGIGFDSCSAKCVENGQTSLTPYNMVAWIGGQEAESFTEPMNTDDTAIKPAARTALTNYLQGGGKLLISSSELAWDFGRGAAAADKKAFLADFMKANYSADSANTFQATGVAGSIFAGMSGITFDNGTGNTYEVRFPDVLATTGGSTVAMNYVGGAGGVAAVQYSGLFGTGSVPGRIVYMGFGFETILSAANRNQIMQAVVNYFNVANVEEWPLY